MGWSGSLTASSSVGSKITFTPTVQNETSYRNYTVGSFKAPKKGVYKFELKGSGGKRMSTASDVRESTGGSGGLTVGYLLLEKDQTVYVGAGDGCCAAFVSKVTGTKLAAISASNLYFVAGGGGSSSASWGASPGNWANGGNGGGTSGTDGAKGGNANGGAAGTQTTGYAYGEGQNGSYGSAWDTSSTGGFGGDGYYGGKAGYSNGGPGAGGGGAGSGYIHASKLTVGSKSYTNSTTTGGGAEGRKAGSVVVTLYANAELPITFDGTKIEKLIYNGVEISSLIYNGTKLFFERLRRWGRCLSSTVPVSA